MKKYFLVSILLLLGTMLGTATAQTITGKVTDPSNQPIDGATVVLQTLDSVFVEATITNTDGTFLLNHQPTRYRLLFQHLLYEALEKEGSGRDAGTFVLQPKDYALQEVVVKGERPLVTVEGSRLSYDMPQLISQRLVTNAYEALKQLPGVIEQNDVLTLAGAGGVSLLLNGRPSSMTYEQLITLLKGMPASRVEKAEVMYSAPPQYHVRGAAINLVLKGYKPGEGGLQGEIRGEYKQQKEAGGNGGVTLAYTSPKVDLDFMYNLQSSYTRGYIDFLAHHTVKGQMYDVNQVTEHTGRSLAHTLRAGGTYKFDADNSLELSYTTQFSPNSQHHSHSSGSISESFNDSRTHHQMHNAALNYTSGFGFRAGADYTNFTSTDTQNFFDRSPEEVETRFVSRSDQHIDRWKIYADQSHSLPHDWTLNYGTSFSYVYNRNIQDYDLPEMQGQNLYNRIREYTYNVYAGFDKPFNSQWTLSASAALEYYQMQNYRKWAVYPTLQLNYMPSASHIFQLSFSSDKTYPDYWTLSGATSYLNGYNESVGNPFLRPYTEYDADLTYILKSKYIFQVSYSYTPDYFMQTVYLDSDRLKAIYNWQNWDYSQELAFTAILPFKVGNWWDSRLTLQASLKHDKASTYYDAPFNQQQWVGVGHWTHTFQLCRQPNLKMEVTAFGQTKSIQGSYYIQPVAFVDAALRYTFAKDRAMLQLKGSDIFNTMNPKTRVRNGAQYLDMNTKSYLQSITLSFSYRFGGYKKKEVKKVDTSRFGN
ncbi:MAG TPA: TonB-dependent receptor family protein [Bacteroides mediterraneensis]|uniref:outer membrane beta-barrel family protein n=1 Tax=Bacteroides mediterraneensis TaxID=1841856 RepID=UPI0026F16329|nr:outer membrane beta-barrel family protein [Bacteroides mediterraneensis]HJH65965.1 TonB-dependent receptor family protein [Bacteroides mediterraneensis]